MSNTSYYRTRLRNKGQVTIPGAIRNVLGVEEGDELVFMTDENGRVVVERVQLIPPDQAWFWSERWQRLEREAQQDIEKNRVHQFNTAEETINFLKKAAGGNNAEDTTD